jgi:hypothetical protein
MGWAKAQTATSLIAPSRLERVRGGLLRPLSST